MKTTDTIVARGTPDVAIIQRAALQDPELSWEAVGLLAYMMSLRKGERVEFDEYIARRPAPRAALEDLLDELSDAGYLRGYDGNDDDVIVATDRPVRARD